MGKVYSGGRVKGEARVLVIDQGGERLLPPAFHLACLFPDGFDWGHSSRGGEQLALALLADALQDGAAALALYKAFAGDWVRKAPRPEWVLMEEHILQWALDKSAGPAELPPAELPPAIPPAEEAAWVDAGKETYHQVEKDEAPKSKGRKK